MTAGPFPDHGTSPDPADPPARRPFPPPGYRPPYQPPPPPSAWRTVGIVVLAILAVCGLVFVGLIVLFVIALNNMGSNK
jgi:hypothetical protein